MQDLRARAVLNRDTTGITVDIVWDAPVDRPHVSSIALKASHEALALRLVRAIEAQVVTPNPIIRTDIHGQTYVTHDTVVLGRTLNADLKRLGY